MQPEFVHQVRNHPFPLFPVSEPGIVCHWRIAAKYFGHELWHRFVYDRDDAIEFLLECYAGKHKYHQVPEESVDYQFASVVGYTTTGTNSITIPSDYVSTGSTVDCIGAGARGVQSASANANHGGGAGAYSQLVTFTASPGDSVTTIIGAENSGTHTDWASSACKANSASANGSTGATTPTGVGTTKRAGGSAGSVSTSVVSASGGGGASGPNGNGAAGGNTGNNSNSATGGGGANGGSAGAATTSAGSAQNGGNNRLGTGGGASAGGGTGTFTGGTGMNGGGGGAAVSASTGLVIGGAGSVDAVYGGSLGPGSGGGAVSAAANVHSGGGKTTGAGGTYGGGSGGGAGFNSTDVTVAPAGQGLIVLQYTPIIAFVRRPIRNLWRN